MEELYQYLWKYRMFGTDFKDGETSVKVISAGLHNVNSGPDFSSAVVKIDGQQWAGNIEIHVRASDWYRHGHDKDSAYDNIVLHVVGHDDVRITRRDGSVIPQIVVKVPDGVIRTHAELQGGLKGIRCGKRLRELPELIVHDWIERMAVERLQSKSERIHDYLRETDGDWEKTAFITLSRALGFGTNGEPFEILGRMLPLNFLRRHSDNLMQLEAMIFGVAGLLQPHLYPYDEYYQLLVREYIFLSAKYGLKSMDASVWKFSRMRPQGMPYRRMALLASAIASGESVFDSVIDFAKGRRKIEEMFAWRVSAYWNSHYTFGSSPVTASSAIGATGRELLMINVVAPLAYLYFSFRDDPDGAEAAMSVLERLRPEKNVIIDLWKSLGIEPDNAFRSQALIHLRREYCDKNKCLQCRFGHRLLLISR